jgi:hypothetical protein
MQNPDGADDPASHPRLDEPSPAATWSELSKRRRSAEQLGIEAVEARAARDQKIAFAARDFVTCGFPLKRPPSNTYARRNGDVTLELVGHSDHGVPYGQDRLIPIWLATAFFAAGKPRDNVIRFRCASDILRAFEQPCDGGIHLRRLRERLLRVFYCSYVVTAEGRIEQRDGQIRKRRLHLMSEIRISLLEPDRPHVNQFSLWQDAIELDAHFANELRRGGRIPIDLETVRALKENPAALDLYVWQAWRSYRLLTNRQIGISVPVFGEGGLLQQIGTSTESPRKARQQLRAWQATIQRVWQNCPNYLDPTCERFHVQPGEALAIGASFPELPGVSLNPPPMRETGVDGHTLQLFRDDRSDLELTATDKPA